MTIQASPRACLFFAFGLAQAAIQARAAEQPRLTRGPYLQALQQDSVIILWETHLPSLGRVRYQLDGGPEIVVNETQPVLAHQVRLDRLPAGSFHLYQVLDGNNALHDNIFRFRAAPPSRSDPVKAVAFGDSGLGSPNQRDVGNLIRSLDPDLLLHMGDLSYTGSLDDVLFSAYPELLAQKAFYPARGNHDMHHDWRAYFPPPNENDDGRASYYSFDWGCAHFVCFDSNSDTLAQGGRQLKWVDEDLARAKTAGSRWLVLYCHEPPFTVGNYGEAPDVVNTQRKTRILIPPLADKHQIDLVISGHDHNYQRSHPVREDAIVDAWQSPEFISPGGTVYIVTGGGGVTLYREDPRADHRFTERFVFAHHAVSLSITPEKLSVEAISPALGRIDAFSIAKEGARPEYRFVRGDADSDGKVNLTDAIGILRHLFLGKSLECSSLSAVVADANASGRVAIDDAMHILNFLFLGGPAPASPFPECGKDTAADGLGCTPNGCR